MGKPTVYAKIDERLEPMVITQVKGDKAVRFRSRYAETLVRNDTRTLPRGRWGPRSVELEVLIPVDVFMEAYPKLLQELSGHGYIGSVTEHREYWKTAGEKAS